jgi:hypothetical protein
MDFYFLQLINRCVALLAVFACVVGVLAALSVGTGLLCSAVLLRNNRLPMVLGCGTLLIAIGLSAPSFLIGAYPYYTGSFFEQDMHWKLLPALTLLASTMVLAGCTSVVYLVPFLIASRRNKPTTRKVLWLNLLAGWLPPVWAYCLCLALEESRFPRLMQKLDSEINRNP